MKVRFYGTRGYVEESSKAHTGHSAFVLEHEGFRLLCDFGQNRKGMLAKIRPDAIWVSHAHPDHGWGLWEGCEVPVYASEVTHELLKEMPILNRVRVFAESAVEIGPFRLTPFPGHPFGALPVHGGADRRPRPDGGVLGRHRRVREPRRSAAPAPTCTSATARLSRARSCGTIRAGPCIGHTTIRAQLGWLSRYGVLRAIFSHFGKGPIEMGEEALREALETLAAEKPPGCTVTAAHDGLELEI